MKRKELPERERLTAGYLKSFFDRIAPSVIRFYPDSFVCGNSWRCVWAIREYPPVTEEQALLSHIGDRAGVTLHVYTRIVDGAEQRQILLNATRKNRMLSGSENLQEAATGVGNLTDIERLLEDLRREREPLLHCAVFLELSADTQESLKLLQTEVQTELTRNRITADRLFLRQKEGFQSCLPGGKNHFGSEYERVLPASAVANLYPFSYSGRTDPHGFYIGRDRFGTNILADTDSRTGERSNGNVLILGNSGQGKSYLLKLLLTNLRMQGKSVICLDAESEYTDLTESLGGCYLDLMEGTYRINPLEPKRWADAISKEDADCPDAFRERAVLDQHISFLRDFFRAYKDFTDPQLDAIGILLTKLYENFGIGRTADLSDLRPTDYPILSDLYSLAEEEYKQAEDGEAPLFTRELLREICLGLHSMCVGNESRFFNGHTNLTDSRFLTFGVKGLMDTNRKLRDAMLFNILSYMNHRLLTDGNTVASIDEAYLFLSNLTTIEYIRNAMKRVRKKNSAVLLASQNIDDFLAPDVREYTKPLFAIPANRFLFYPGHVEQRDFCDALSISPAEYALIDHPERGVCLYHCGNARYLLQVQAPEFQAKLFGDAGGR